MRVTTASGRFFQSYKEIEFDYSNLGLALVAGQMKAGKSTLMDLVCWTLYGKTSKDSAADDVRSWFADGEVTEGIVRVETGTEVLIVTRRRGKSSAKNDLYFQVEGSEELIRGKDARNDTQALLNERLGIDADLYIAASYLHQFSRADQFFLSKAKDRRETLERIADQSFAVALGERMSESKKNAKKARDAENEVRIKLEGRAESGRAAISDLTLRSKQWRETHARRVQDAERARTAWEDAHKVRIQEARDAVDAFEAGRAARVAAAQRTADDWEAARGARGERVQADSETWQASQTKKIKSLKDSSEKWAADQGARAMRIADQLALLDKEIVSEKDFETQKTQLKTQIKAAEQAAVELGAKSKELAVLNQRITALQQEFGRLESLDGTCPTCLGPADNEHSQARKIDIENEVAGILETQDALAGEVAALEAAVSVRGRLYESYQAVGTREAQNKAKIEKAGDLRAQVLVIKAEPNPYAKQIASAQAETNPHHARLDAVMAETNPHLSGVAHAETESNPHTPNLAAVEKEINPSTATLKLIKAEKNPYEPQIEMQVAALQGLDADLAASSKALDALDHKITSLTWLYDKSFELRGQLLESAVRQIQDGTNEILERFFDAELRVRFSLPDSDKLEVEIVNEGYPCPFKQLSGGERTLLCRAFSFAYMRAAENTAGVKLDQLMLDEVLNGLDAAMKIKAFSLLQSLSEDYSTILLIDHHQEFQQMFPTQFLVEKRGAYSAVSRVDSE